MSTDFSEEDPNSVFFTTIAVELSLGVAAVVLGWLTGVDVRQFVPRLEAGNAWLLLGGVGWGVVAAIPIILAVAAIERIDCAPIRRLKTLDEVPMIAALLALPTAELFAISIAAGVGEELLVRGWLMGWIVGPLSTSTPLMIGLGLLVSSVAFGLMHPITPTYAVLATLIGLYFGGLLIWTENLIVPIVAHAFYDAVHLVLSKRDYAAKINLKAKST